MSRYWLAMAVVLSACGGNKQQTLVCVNDSQCAVNGVMGKCVQPDQRCAIPKASCDSGYAYDKTAGGLAGTCVPLPPPPTQNGGTCTSDSECASGICADGYCCNDRCAGKCTSCAVPGSEGACTAVPSGAPDPHKQCANDGTTCGHDGTCDGSGGCHVASPDTVCKPPSCSAGILTPMSKCDGSGNCVTPATRDCDPYVCNADGTDCYSSCTAAGNECKPPNSCSSGSCGLLKQGATCSDGTQCATGKCTDGVCCNASVCDPCFACNVNGLGTCAPKGAGATDFRCQATPSTTCGVQGSVCSATGCALWPAGTQCKAPYCGMYFGASGLWQKSVCDGVHASCPDQQFKECNCQDFGGGPVCLMPN